MKLQSNLNNLVNVFIFWRNLAKRFARYVTKFMVDAILKTISIKEKVLNFKNHSPFLLLTSKTLYYRQYSGDFTHFVPQTRELVLHSWLARGSAKGGLVGYNSHLRSILAPSRKVKTIFFFGDFWH